MNKLVIIAASSSLLIGILAAVASVGAGVYLLSQGITSAFVG